MKNFIRKCPFVASIVGSCLILLLFFAAKGLLQYVEKLNTDLIFANNNMRYENQDDEDKSDSMDQSGAADGTSDTVPETDILLDEDGRQVSETDENSADEKINESEDSMNADGEESSDEEENSIEEDPIGVTEFVYYEPKEVDSQYYSDPGRKPLTTIYPYEEAGDDYFSNAAFIGDSRTMGLYDYGDFEGADFYCDNGFCVYQWERNGTVTYQNERSKVNLSEAFKEKSYGKIYLMIGMNDCGYGNAQTFREGLEHMLLMIEETQPEAIIYLLANMYITEEKESREKIFNNIHINDKNVQIAECADGIRSFYLDYNDLYLDETGHIKKEYTFDGVHLYGSCYEPWITYIKEHTITKK